MHNTPPPSRHNHLHLAISRKVTCIAGLVSAFFSSYAFAADYTYDKNHDDLIENSALLNYSSPIDGKSFHIDTTGFESPRGLKAISALETDGVSIVNTQTSFVIGNAITTTFDGIAAGFDGLPWDAQYYSDIEIGNNFLTIIGNDEQSISNRAHLAHIGYGLGINIFNNTFEISKLQSRANSIATVSASGSLGIIKNNNLKITDSQFKKAEGVTGTAIKGDEGQGLKLIENSTEVINSGFNELRGAELSGIQNSEDELSGNKLTIVNPTILAEYGGSLVIAQELSGYATNADKNKIYKDVSNGELIITGKLKVENASGERWQSTEFGAGKSSMSGVSGNRLIFKDLASEVVSMNQWLTYGGFSSSTKGDATSNSVTFDNAKFSGGKFVYGGFATNGKAHANGIDIKNGSIVEGNFIGSYGGLDTTAAYVTIDNSTVLGTVAVFSGDKKRTKLGEGTLTVQGLSDLSEAILHPYSLTPGVGDNDEDRGLQGYTGQHNVTFKADGFAGAIKQFGSAADNVAFDHVVLLGQTWNRQDAILTVLGSAAFKSSSLEDGSLSFVDGEAVAKGGTITLLKANNGITYVDPLEETEKDLVSTAGTALQFNGKVNFGENQITYTVESAESSSQTILVGDSRLAAAAFVNQGTDLLERVFHGFTLSREKYGLMTFATAEGTKNNYDLSNPIKINGWNFLAGLRSVAAVGVGDLTTALFVEYGEGNYRTSNSHFGLKFRTDGELQYVGGGLAVRLIFPSELYFEGSIRAGELQSDLNRALMDADGNHYDADTTSLYAGLHLGAGFITRPVAGMELDSYAKYFFTYTDSDSFTISKFNETYSFQSIVSHRLRLGTRASWSQSNMTYLIGVAGEYEFDAESDMVAANAPARTSDLGGFSGFAEAGLSIRPSLTSPWQFDLQVRGWVGQREAVAGMATVNYLF